MNEFASLLGLIFIYITFIYLSAKLKSKKSPRKNYEPSPETARENIERWLKQYVPGKSTESEENRPSEEVGWQNTQQENIIETPTEETSYAEIPTTETQQITSSSFGARGVIFIIAIGFIILVAVGTTDNFFVREYFPQASSPTTEQVQVSTPPVRINVPQQTSTYLRLISPRGGETICIGDTLNIKWESMDIDRVWISLIYNDTQSRHTQMAIENIFLPSNHNLNDRYLGEYDWVVGKQENDFTKGSNYRILIGGSVQSPRPSYFSDQTYNISFINCE